MGPTKEAFAAHKHRSLICATCLLTARLLHLNLKESALHFLRSPSAWLESNNADAHTEKEQYFLIWTAALVCVLWVHPRKSQNARGAFLFHSITLGRRVTRGEHFMVPIIQRICIQPVRRPKSSCGSRTTIDKSPKRGGGTTFPWF